MKQKFIVVRKTKSGTALTVTLEGSVRVNLRSPIDGSPLADTPVSGLARVVVEVAPARSKMLRIGSCQELEVVE
jgi:hypothetical protein